MTIFHKISLSATAWVAAANLSLADTQFTKGEPAHVDVSHLQVPEGLEVTLWASTPQLYNPTNMDVDQHGRIWVTEGVNYRGKRGRRKEGDRIVVLEDSTGDGKADKTTVFWQSPELGCPLGIAVFDNKIVISQAPDLIVLTDVDRDLKFDPEVDTKEVLLTGFNAEQHDHSLHSLTAGPDGKWYFNSGNCGAVFTDKSGKTFRIGGPYYKSGGGVWPIDTFAIMGEKSDDGHVYAPGFTVRMDPDGSNVEIIGQGYRNSYENINDSLGNLFQNDNDDPPACRNSYVMEYGSAGYFTEDSRRFYNSEWRKDQSYGDRHWRQQDPDTFDAGDIYGGGSPTGVAFYENGVLGEAFAGTYLSCEPGRNVIFGYQPEVQGAGFLLERRDFITSNVEGDFVGGDFTRVGRDLGADGKQQEIKKERAIDKDSDEVDARLFRPSDVVVGTDGAIYLADWFDGRVGGHTTFDETCSGAIYRIAPKGFTPKTPEFSLETTEGRIAALSSPANNVRWLGFHALRANVDTDLTAVQALAKNSNPWLAARALWLLPQMGEVGRSTAEGFLASEDANKRLVAYRALRRVAADISEYAKLLVADESAAVRRDVALSLRDVPAEVAVPILAELVKTCDSEDQNALLAIRVGATGKRDELWQAVRASQEETWTPAFVKLTWSLGSKSAVSEVAARASDAGLDEPTREFALETLSFINHIDAAKALFALCKEGQPLSGEAQFWFVRRAFGAWEDFDLSLELQELGLYDPDNSEVLPAPLPEPPAEPSYTVADVLKLKGDVERGKVVALRCATCHEVQGAGVAYGPNLKGWGSRQSDEASAMAIVNPSNDIAHGFEGHRLILKEGGEIHGKMERWGAPTIVVSMGGNRQIFPPSKVHNIVPLKRSLMLSADQLALTPQDVADLVEYLKVWE